MILKTELVPTQCITAERIEPEDATPKVGQWVWVKLSGSDHESADRHDGEHHVWLGCITHVGSNFVKIQGVRFHTRIHFDQLDERCTPEPNPTTFIAAQIDKRRERVRELLAEVRRVAAALGVTPMQALEDSTDHTTQALATASGTADVKAHEAALIKAEKQTLPELFKRVENENEWLAKWMHAEVIPLKAELEHHKQVIEPIKQRIFTVQLYAGLVEQLEQIADGAPAPNDAKVHLFQRRHYMDEECLIHYTAGGMKFDDLAAFDAWLVHPENRDRLLPMPRCIVAFRVRRWPRKYDSDASIADFIKFFFESDYDKITFLYIRNGDQVWRLNTAVEFDAQLFPNREESTLLAAGSGEKLWMEVAWNEPRQIIPDRQYQNLLRERAEEHAEYKRKLAAWKRLPKRERDARPRPSYWPPHEVWEPVDQSSTFYDAAMQKMRDEMNAHNRIAVVIQGLLDRSPALHPHPPWRIWTPEGFERAIELVYDTSHALTPGDAPDFEAYRARLNASLKPGCVTVGQQAAWMRAMAEKYNHQHQHERERTHYKPYGNPGPGELARVKRIDRNGRCHYTWIREHKTERSWREGAYPTKFACSPDKLLNVDAYTPGDFKIFFDDPRTRANYIEWAPLLLLAEDYHAGKRRIRDENTDEGED